MDIGLATHGGRISQSFSYRFDGGDDVLLGRGL
jgi:hypothetical protein